MSSLLGIGRIIYLILQPSVTFFWSVLAVVHPCADFPPPAFYSPHLIPLLPFLFLVHRSHQPVGCCYAVFGPPPPGNALTDPSHTHADASCVPLRPHKSVSPLFFLLPHFIGRPPWLSTAPRLSLVGF